MNVKRMISAAVFTMALLVVGPSLAWADEAISASPVIADEARVGDVTAAEDSTGAEEAAGEDAVTGGDGVEEGATSGDGAEAGAIGEDGASGSGAGGEGASDGDAADGVADEAAAGEAAAGAGAGGGAGTTDGELGDSAPLEDGGVYRIATSLDSGIVLDVAGASAAEGANVQVYASNDTLAQLWKATFADGGFYRFLNLASQRYLGFDAEARSGSNVISTGASAALATWRVEELSDGTFALVPYAHDSLRLDLSGANATSGSNMQLYVANGTAAQRFRLTFFAALTEAVRDGRQISLETITIESALQPGKVIDVTGASAASGANVQAYDANRTFAQKFAIRNLGSNLYSFINGCGGKALDVAGASRDSGANVQVYDSNGTLAQIWYLLPLGDGFSLRSALSGLALDVAGASTANGANVQLYVPNGTPAQAFALIAVPVLEEGTYVFSSGVIDTMVLGVAPGGFANGANVQTARSRGDGSETFDVTLLADGSCTLRHRGSGRYVDVAGGSGENCANVQLYDGNGTAAQKWVASFAATGGVCFRNVGSGRYLDVTAASRFSGANVQQYDGNGTAAQSWIVHPGDWSFFGSQGTGALQMRYIESAERYEGWAYRWGGRSPATGFDCAGLVMFCSNEVYGTGYDLMLTNAARLYTYTTHLSADQARPGDLVFFRGTYGSDIDYISHVVIYCGNGIIYGAGNPVGYQRISDVRNIAGQPATCMFARIR